MNPNFCQKNCELNRVAYLSGTLPYKLIYCSQESCAEKQEETDSQEKLATKPEFHKAWSKHCLPFVLNALCV